MAMFEEFSAGYYVGRLYIEPYDGEHAVMERAQHEAANEQIYNATADEGITRMDQPLVAKVDDRHFPVLGATDVPSDTLAIPDDRLEETRVTTPPAVKSVLVAKADRAAQLLEWWTPYTMSDPDYT